MNAQRPVWLVQTARESQRFLELITGELSDDGGEIVKSQKARIGYMEQQACRNDENTVYGEVLTVFSELMKIENELNNIALSIEMNEGDIDSLISRQMVLNDKFERDGGLTYRSRGRSALLGLGFSENELDMKIGELRRRPAVKSQSCKAAGVRFQSIAFGRAHKPS